MDSHYLPGLTIFEKLPNWITALSGALLLGAIWLGDYFVRVNLGFSLFYVFPIAIFTWYLSPRLGYLASLASSILWLIAEQNRILAETNPYYLTWNTLVRLGFFFIVTTLLAKLRLAYQREQQLAQTDSLTSLMNRRAFFATLTHEMKRSQRHQWRFTLAYLDVDHFKQVNDGLGHEAGDIFLQKIARVLVTQVRSTDYPARLGGDEFVLLLPQTDKAQATLVLSRVYANLLRIDMPIQAVGFSIGAVTFNTIPESADTVIAIADKLMYAIKANGKHQLMQQEY